jgi:GR25 family glycosyltransferase involved in LPS biosynthesis
LILYLACLVSPTIPLNKQVSLALRRTGVLEDSNRDGHTNSKTLKIHVVNLDRSTERLALFQRANSHVMPLVERFSAVDGKNVDRAALVGRGIIAADLGYNDGALGNALSHIALWDKAIREERSFTICEDDALFNRSFCEVSEAVLEQLPPDWHLIAWGWNFNSILWFDLIPGVSGCVGQFDQGSLRKGIDVFQSADLRPRAYRLFQSFGTICYSISSNGARLLRQNCLPLRNTSVYVPGLKAAVMNLSIDVALNGVYSHVNSFVSIPPLVVTKNDHNTSTVQAKRYSATS